MNEQLATTPATSRDGSRGKRRLPICVATVLHIDDDPNDTELLRAAARRAGAEFLLHNVNDGEQAIAYLSGQGLFADRQVYQRPSLVLLDLKMPRATGFEILGWIRNHAELGKIPVVVLSGSELKADIQRAYDIGANSYLIKQPGFQDLVQLVRSLHAVWLANPPQQG